MGPQRGARRRDLAMRPPPSLFAVVLIAACGEIAPASGPREPVFVVRGLTDGGPISAPEGRYAAEAHWLSFGGGAGVGCFASPTPWECFEQPLETQTSRQDLGVEAGLLQGFELSAWALLPEDSLLDLDGARLALGTFIIYDDRDESSNVSTGDVVVAGSAFNDTQVSLLAYREGPVHPFYQLMVGLFGCPEPPPGYSVIKIDRRVSCRVSRLVSVVATPRRQLPETFSECGGDVVRLLDPQPQKPAELEEGQARFCLGENQARTFMNTGDPCAPYRAVRLDAIQACRRGPLFEQCWDDRDQPLPPDWDCPVERE